MERKEKCREMRLIDADLYRAALEKTLVEMEKAGESQTDIADGVRRALRMLDMQPDIADVAPVVHGETSDFYNMIQALDEKSRKIGLTEKERLEKLIYEGLYEMQGAVVIGLNGGYGMLADYLIDNGVIALSIEDDGRWIPADVAEPEPDLFVLVSVSGTYRNIEFVHAAEIGCITEGGWYIEAYPEWDNPHVEYWRMIQRTPMEEKERRKPTEEI